MTPSSAVAGGGAGAGVGACAPGPEGTAAQRKAISAPKATARTRRMRGMHSLAVSLCESGHYPRAAVRRQETEAGIRACVRLRGT